MTDYRHNMPILVRIPGTSAFVAPGRIDDHLHPTERANMPPGHHCVRFDDGGRMLFPERDLKLIPAVIR